MVETVKMLPLICQFRCKSPWKRLKAVGTIYFFRTRKTAGNNGTKLILHYSLTCLWCQPCLWHLNKHKITDPILAQRDEFICSKYRNPSTPNLLTARLHYKTTCSSPGMGHPLLSFPNHCTAQGVFPANSHTSMVQG